MLHLAESINKGILYLLADFSEYSFESSLIFRVSSRVVDLGGWIVVYKFYSSVFDSSIFFLSSRAAVLY